MLGAIILIVSLAVAMVPAALAGLVAFARRPRSGRRDRIMEPAWWPDFERQFAEYVATMDQGAG